MKEETAPGQYKDMRVQFVDDIFAVPYDELEELGVTELLFDYDGTLVRRMRDEPSPETMQLLHELSERFAVRIFSNNQLRVSARRAFFEQHGITYVRTYKPLGNQKIGEKPVLIGDKFLTDGLYALRRNIPCFLVRNRLSFLVEKLF